MNGACAVASHLLPRGPMFAPRHLTCWQDHIRTAQRLVVRRRSDLVGFTVFAALALWTAVRMPAAGFLLMPTFAYELCLALAFLIRDRPCLTDSGVAKRLAAYGGTFIIIAFFQTARLWRPELTVATTRPSAILLGLLFWMTGLLVAFGSLYWLRHSFSIEPEARRLVTSGPYALARHPIYSGYIVHYTGLAFVFPSLAFGAVLLIWLGLTLARMRFEERVLAAAFVEYAEYRGRVGARAPRLIGLRANKPIGTRAAFLPQTTDYSR